MKKSVAIELDKTRNLRLGVNARSKAQELLGKPLSDMKDGAGEMEIRVLLYCGLVWEDPTLDLESIGDLMDDLIMDQGVSKTYEYLGQKIGEAIDLSMPKKK